MRVVRAGEHEREIWRDGVETRMLASAANGAQQLTVFEQWCAPGHGAPDHLHAVEEVLQVLEGRADVHVDGEHRELGSGDAALIPAGAVHGFENISGEALHILAILAAPIFEAHYLDGPRDSRRWGPERHSS